MRLHGRCSAPFANVGDEGVSCSGKTRALGLRVTTTIDCPGCRMSPGDSVTHEVVFVNIGPVACKVSLVSECQDGFLRYGDRETWKSREKVLVPAHNPEPAHFTERLTLADDFDAGRLPTHEDIHITAVRRVDPDGRQEPLAPIYLSVELVKSAP